MVNLLYLVSAANSLSMNVILLTAFIGLILVGLAVSFFVFTRKSAATSSPERDSLMPLEDEQVARHGDRR